MHKIKLFAVAAAMTATGFGVWAASNSNPHVAPSVGQVDPIQVMSTAKDLPTTAKGLPTIEFADYTFVFPSFASGTLSKSVSSLSLRFVALAGNPFANAVSEREANDQTDYNFHGEGHRKPPYR